MYMSYVSIYMLSAIEYLFIYTPIASPKANKGLLYIHIMNVEPVKSINFEPKICRPEKMKEAKQCAYDIICLNCFCIDGRPYFMHDQEIHMNNPHY